MKTFRTMLKTELKLSLRGMDMFIFTICVPIVVLVILGILYGNKPAYEGAEYTLFGAIFRRTCYDFHLRWWCYGIAVSRIRLSQQRHIEAL